MNVFWVLHFPAESNFQNFFQYVSVAEFTEKFCIYNINAPGQEVDAAPLPEKWVIKYLVYETSSV